MRLRAVAAAYALWILGTFVVFYLVKGSDENALQLAVMCGAIPATCQILLLGIDWRGLVAPIRLWLALLLVILLSYVASGLDPRTAPSATEGLAIPAAWTPVVYTLNTIFVLGVATLVAGCPDRRLLRSIAGLYSIFSTPFLIYIDLTGETVWGRLTADLNPSVWGLMGLTGCLGALARKPGLLAAAAFTSGVTTILLASSRENLLALAGALAVVLALYLRDMTRPRLWITLAGSCITLVTVALLLDPYILDAIHYVKHDVLLFDSADRGLESGFTGRTEVWEETIGLWLKSPLFGVGFRQHEQFLAGAPAHNAYLAMLADTGLFGLLVYLVVLIGSLVASWGIEDPRTRRFVITVLVTYIFIGFFERRAINTGNPYGVFFLMCCSVALVDQSLRRTSALLRKLPQGREGAVPAADPALPAG